MAEQKNNHNSVDRAEDAHGRAEDHQSKADRAGDHHSRAGGAKHHRGIAEVYHMCRPTERIDSLVMTIEATTGLAGSSK